MCAWTRTGSFPEDKGRLVTAFLEEFFRKYVEYDFTAALEQKLDLVSAGELDWKALLREFWQDFHGAVGEIAELRVTNVLDALNEALGPHIFPAREDGTDPRACPTCGVGQLSLKTGKFGAFIGCSNYPECRYTRPLAAPDGEEAEAQNGDRELGVDPETGQTVYLKAGRFGPYVQLGEGDKPKRFEPAEGMASRSYGSGKGASPAAPTARSRDSPRRRTGDPGRNRALRSVRPAQRRLTPISRTPTRCSRSD